MRSRRDEMVELILWALHEEGIKFQQSIKSTEILSYHLISLADSNCREFILKLRAFKNRIKISSWNSSYLFEFDLENNVVRYTSRSKKVARIIAMLEKQGVIGPSMSCYQYVGHLFTQTNGEWHLISKKTDCEIYLNANSNISLIIKPFYIGLRDFVEPSHRLRIEYQQNLQDDFTFVTHSRRLSDILFFLGIYQELDKMLNDENAWCINQRFHQIL